MNATFVRSLARAQAQRVELGPQIKSLMSQVRRQLRVFLFFFLPFLYLSPFASQVYFAAQQEIDADATYPGADVLKTVLVIAERHTKLCLVCSVVRSLDLYVASVLRSVL